MLTKTLAATSALSLMVGGGSAIAAQSKSSAMVGPKQPIPYAQLNAYLKASPKARASKDWWAGSATASTGMSTDTSATTSMSPSTAPSTGMTPDSAVNPAPTTAPPSMPMTPPTDATPMPSDPTQTNQPAPGAPASPPVTPPTEPK